MEFQTLNNGIKIPVLGFGVWQIFDQKECQKATPYKHHTSLSSRSACCRNMCVSLLQASGTYLYIPDIILQLPVPSYPDRFSYDDVQSPLHTGN